MQTDIQRNSIGVLLAGAGFLLGDVIENMVRHKPEFRLATLKETDLAVLREVIERDTPDVILVCQANAFDSTKTLEDLKKIVVERHLRIIVIRADDNILEVYDKRNIRLTSSKDLFELIENR